MLKSSAQFRFVVAVLFGVVLLALAHVASAHVNVSATNNKNSVKVYWKFPCSGPPPVVDQRDTSTTGNPPPDIYVAYADRDPDNENNVIVAGGAVLDGSEYTYVRTEGCAEAGGTRLQTVRGVPWAQVGTFTDPNNVPLSSMVKVGIERTVVPLAPDVVRITLLSGGLRTRVSSVGDHASATLKMIVYPNQAAADADATTLNGTGSAFFGTLTLLGDVGSLIGLNGFSLSDFLVQNDGGGQFTATPITGLSKVALVPDANQAVVTVVGDPKTQSSSETVLGAPLAGVPGGLWLASAAPNPAHGPTSIRFAIPREGRVTMGIYDQQGRRVLQLIDGRLPAGEHEARWDGRDASGRQVPSALYFYKMNVDGEKRMGKVFFIR